MINTLEPLVEEISILDWSTKERIQKYPLKQQEMKVECDGCYSSGCYSPSSCIDCYSVD